MFQDKTCIQCGTSFTPRAPRSQRCDNCPKVAEVKKSKFKPASISQTPAKCEIRAIEFTADQIDQALIRALSLLTPEQKLGILRSVLIPESSPE